MNSFLPGEDTFSAQAQALKRTRRTQTRKAAVPSPPRSRNTLSVARHSRPLLTIEELSEEADELSPLAGSYGGSSVSSRASSNASTRSIVASHSKSVKARRNSGVTSYEDLLMLNNGDPDIFTSTKPPRPAPIPPPIQTSLALHFADGLSLDFPQPPTTAGSSSSSPWLSPVKTPKSSRRHGSVSPSSPVQSTASSICPPSSPSTASESDELADFDFVTPSPSPTKIVPRVSIKPLTINKAIPELHRETSIEDIVDEEAAWYAQEMSEMLLSSPSSTSVYSGNARRDSCVFPMESPLLMMAPKKRLHSRMSKPLPTPPPTLLLTPPPVPQLPPAFRRAPRSSIPVDIGLDSQYDFDEYEADGELPHLASSASSISSVSMYSSEDGFELGVDIPIDFLPPSLSPDSDGQTQHLPPTSLPSTPMMDSDLERDILSHLRSRSDEGHSPTNMSPTASLSRSSSTSNSRIAVEGAERQLRSRWSSSTLSSLIDQPSPSPAAKLRSYITSATRRSSSNAVAKPITPVSPVFKLRKTPPAPVQTHSGVGRRRSSVVYSNNTVPAPVWDFPGSPLSPHTPGLGYGLSRRGSRSSSSATSSDSGDSTASNGLKRKPIPWQLLVD